MISLYVMGVVFIGNDKYQELEKETEFEQTKIKVKYEKETIDFYEEIIKILNENEVNINKMNFNNVNSFHNEFEEKGKSKPIPIPKKNNL